MLYVGVRMNATYINYGWEIKDASVFGTKHSYAIGYENGIYYLSLDGGQRQTMTHINFNQADQTRLTEPEKDSKNLNELIRTVIAQDYIEMTNIGIKEFVCNCEISDFTVKTSAINGYRRLISHPFGGERRYSIWVRRLHTVLPAEELHSAILSTKLQEIRIPRKRFRVRRLLTTELLHMCKDLKN